MSVTGPGPTYSLGFVLCAAFILHAWRQRRLRGGLPLPPGPPGLPFIGNIFDLNPVHPWVSYEQWGKRYGGLIYANILGKDFIIINSRKVAHDLLDRRSAIYSQRPHVPANEMFGMDFNSGLLPYGNVWRLHRKLFHTCLNKKMAPRFKPLAISKSRQLVENILDDPEDFAKHCKTYAAGATMGAMYGYEVASKDDPLVEMIEHWISLFVNAITPEWTALIIAFPLLAHIPPWLPGGWYKQQAAGSRALAKNFLTKTIKFVTESVADGTAKESLVRDLLEKQGEANLDLISGVAASGFLGGAETSDSTLRVFLLAMVLHPEVQVKAWEEINRVVGNGRLPDFDDRLHLPYVEGVYLESLRWRPVVPCAIPHTTATSDVYEGMYIPEGAIVLVNIWGMGHDESQFDDAMAFIPERHLTPTGEIVKGPAPPCFSFGPRICPGRHLADQNVWAAIVTILATMHVAKACDKFGNEIPVREEFTSGISTAPKPFVCRITPRSTCVEKLIRARQENGH